ncbi:MAG: hypothetical protein H6719_34770 [Sandaracinaceae bacterium]|nr:hypothetical protein [Sandaracinaceae bacterium]
MRAIRALALTVGLVAAAPASAQAPVVHRVEIEDPRALSHFYDALTRLEREPDRRVRVFHWGDSNVAADLWTAVTREALQRRFGHGGSGYLLPRSMGSWHRGPVRLVSDGGWAPRRRGFARDFGPNDGLWGLAGVAIEASRPHASLIAEVPEAGVERVVELHLLGRPRPGRVELRVDGGDWETISTLRPRPELIVVRRALDGAAHRVSVRHAGGVPRVLGLVVERRSGVVYDVLGINGHRASALLAWNEALIAEQLAARAPDLVVLSYGGNEALDPNLALSTYEEQTDAAIARVRRLAPGASCLLVGPLATYEEHASRMSAVTTIQRRLAAAHGCAFWDSAATSGGPGTLGRWGRFPGMVGHDRLHLGRLGYEEVGRGFVSALLRGAGLM